MQHERPLPDRATIPADPPFGAARLVVEGVRLVRGERGLFEELSFAVAAGEARQVTGPNGAGKTSLLRAVAALQAIEAGRIALEPEEETPLAERAHFIGHLDAVKPALTLAENLAFWAAMLGGASGETEPALAALGLADLADLPAAILSAGQRRRLALARLIVAARPLWILDEPMTALDKASAALFTTLMERHLKAGGLILAATHGPLGLAAATETRLA